jgi:predicted small secreted protein
MFRTINIKPMAGLIVAFLTAAMLLTACNTQQGTGSFAQIPAGLAYAEGGEIYFTHTEASDPAIAEKLTNMMKSPVLYVSSLALVPEEALAKVYVFENGLSGKGPLGFQPDVFNNPPGTDGYSPLRQIFLTQWVEGVKAVVLKSEAEIIQAETDGKLTTRKSGVVVNMPFLVWDSGKR